MTLLSSPILATPLLASTVASSSAGTGELSALDGFGTQGELQLRSQRFWANETQTRFTARDSDGEEMIGVTDKDPYEHVWYEVDFIDLLRGASITSVSFSLTPGLSMVTYQLVSNGASVHLVRALLAGGGVPGTENDFSTTVTNSDGSIRKRTLKVRSRAL